MTRFGERLKKLRTEKKISMCALASDLNISKGLISRWEKGSSEPSAKYVVTVAKYFNVSSDYLLGLKEN